MFESSIGQVMRGVPPYLPFFLGILSGGSAARGNPVQFFLFAWRCFLTWVFQWLRHLPKNMRLRKIRGYAIGIVIGRCCGGSNEKSGSCETDEHTHGQHILIDRSSNY